MILLNMQKTDDWFLLDHQFKAGMNTTESPKRQTAFPVPITAQQYLEIFGLSIPVSKLMFYVQDPIF